VGYFWLNVTCVTSGSDVCYRTSGWGSNGNPNLRDRAKETRLVRISRFPCRMVLNFQTREILISKAINWDVLSVVAVLLGTSD
jgi:hypothetical protein